MLGVQTILTNTWFVLAVMLFWLVVFAAAGFRFHRRAMTPEFKETRREGERVLGAAHVGIWHASTPLAALWVSDDAILVEGRIAIVPLPARLFRKDGIDSISIERKRSKWRLSISSRDSGDSARFIAFSDPSAILVRHGWQVPILGVR